jgi:hypothetical protein
MQPRKPVPAAPNDHARAHADAALARRRCSGNRMRSVLIAQRYNRLCRRGQEKHKGCAQG